MRTDSLPNEILIVRCEGKAYEQLKNQPRSDQGGVQGAGPRKGRIWKEESHSESSSSPTRFPDQYAFKLMYRTHIDSDQEFPYTVGKLTRRPFQRIQSHLQIRPESSGIAETIRVLLSVPVLRHRKGLGPCIRVEPNSWASLAYKIDIRPRLNQVFA